MSDSKEVEEKKIEFKGLQNQGGTCYMNSLLQALYMTDEFRQMIFKWRYDPNVNADKKDCILYQLQILFAGLMLSKQPYISTTALTNSFQWDYKESFEQQDVQEFMRVLFDAIEQSFEINNTFGVIEDIYSGEGIDYVNCLECGYRSERVTKFYDLQLPVKNEFENISNDSIEKAIFGYLKPEKLEGINAYQCQQCNKKCSALKGSRLRKLPRILTLQLNRFTMDMQTWQRKKINDRVSFPLLLNMNHFLDESKQQDISKTQQLVQQNPLNTIKQGQFKPQLLQSVRDQELQSIAKNRFDSFMEEEIGNFQETIEPQVMGTLAQKRAEEKKQKDLAHRSRLAHLKKTTKPTVKKPAFDKSSMNSNFFANAKNNKDKTQGWAFDFENPDAMKDDDNQLQRAIQQSIETDKLSKSSENATIELIQSEVAQKQNHSAQPKNLSHDEKTQKSTIDTLKSTEYNNPHKSKEETIHYVQQENLKLLEIYKSDGQFVYELFACLVHQGGAMGGHYFAYILDNKSQMWHNFNDYRVNQCDIFELTDMFGGQSSRTIHSSTNAYMLMYRLHTENQEQVYCELPEEIIQLIELQDQKLDVPVDKELRQQLMSIKIFRHFVGKELSEDLPYTVIHVHRQNDTYQTLIKLAFEKLGIQNQENFRLRAYNVHNRIMMETYTGQEESTLEQLKIYPMKTLILEEKLDQFQEYDPTTMVLKINLWREGIQALSEEILKPIHFIVNRDLPMIQFIQQLEIKFGLVDPLVMKRNPMLNQKQLELLNCDKSLSQLRINEGLNLFVESKTQFLNWEKEFELDQNRLQVKFNIPSDKLLDVHYKNFLIADRRLTVLDLKLQIANKLEMQLSELVFKRGGTHGSELIDDEITLKQAQFYNMICVFVAQGVPSQVGYKRLKILIAQDYIHPDDAELALDSKCFEFIELAEMPIRTSSTVEKIKKQLEEKFEQISGKRFILREKSGDDKMTQVFDCERTLNSYQVYDGKEIVIQFLPIEEEQEPGQDFCFIMVRLWSPSTWQLSAIVQISVSKKSTLNDFKNLIVQRYNLSSQESVQACKIASSWNFGRVQLPHEQWIELNDNNAFMASKPFYMSSDGLLFIIKIGNEKQREMTDEENLKYNTSQFEFNTSTATSERLVKQKNNNKESGVKITVKKAVCQTE